MRQYLDGTTSSGVYEARLGRETFGKKCMPTVWHSPARHPGGAAIRGQGHLQFAVTAQGFSKEVRGLKVGSGEPRGSAFPISISRIRPGRYSRLGVADIRALRKRPGSSAASCSLNCENADFGNFSRHLDRIGRE